MSYPNPFNAVVTIPLDVPKESSVRLLIYDVRGRLVRTLADRTFKPGTYFIRWNGTDDLGRNAATGIYIYRLETPVTDATRELILVK